MTKIQIVLLVIAVLLFFLGLWPVSIGLTVAVCIIGINEKKKKTVEMEKRINELEQKIKNNE